MDIDELLCEMNKRYWDTLGSENVIHHFSDEVKNHDPSKYVTQLVSSGYHHTFVFSNLLYNTNAWSKLNLSDWLTVIERIERQHDTKLIIDDYGRYADIIFLYKYLKIDSLDLINRSGIDTMNKLSILNTLRKLYKVMYLDETDVESFRDGTYPHGDEYATIHARLIDQGAVTAEIAAEKIQDAILRSISLTTPNAPKGI